MNFACVYMEGYDKFLVYKDIESYQKKTPNEISDVLVDAQYYMFVVRDKSIAEKIAEVVK